MADGVEDLGFNDTLLECAQISATLRMGADAASISIEAVPIAGWRVPFWDGWVRRSDYAAASRGSDQ